MIRIPQRSVEPSGGELGTSISHKEEKGDKTAMIGKRA